MAIDIGNKVTYIATSLPIDEEMEMRIKLHKDKRPLDWGLIEAYRNFNFSNLGIGDTLLLDCITIMVTNILYDEVKDWNSFDQLNRENVKTASKVEEVVLSEVKRLIDKLRVREGRSILVTNEIGLGLVPENFINRVYRDILGRVNQYLANEADEVHFCISGIDLKIKG
jgi:adenosylcobinamide kinase/adenosylcobinamide-phosphate guanylyltransferase